MGKKSRRHAPSTIVAGLVGVLLGVLCLFAAYRYVGVAADAESVAQVSSIQEMIDDLEPDRRAQLEDRDLSAKDLGRYLRLVSQVSVAIEGLSGLVLLVTGAQVLFRTGEGRKTLQRMSIFGVIGSLLLVVIAGPLTVILGVLGCAVVFVTAGMKSTIQDLRRNSSKARNHHAVQRALAKRAENMTWIIGPNGNPLEAGWLESGSTERGTRLAAEQGLGVSEGPRTGPSSSKRAKKALTDQAPPIAPPSKPSRRGILQGSAKSLRPKAADAGQEDAGQEEDVDQEPSHPRRRAEDMPVPETAVAAFAPSRSTGFGPLSDDNQELRSTRSFDYSLDPTPSAVYDESEGMRQADPEARLRANGLTKHLRIKNELPTRRSDPAARLRQSGLSRAVPVDHLARAVASVGDHDDHDYERDDVADSASVDRPPTFRPKPRGTAELEHTDDEVLPAGGYFV